VGHSQGTQIFLLLAIQNASLINSKIQSASLLSPVLSIKNISNWSLKQFLNIVALLFS